MFSNLFLVYIFRGQFYITWEKIARRYRIIPRYVDYTTNEIHYSRSHKELLLERSRFDYGIFVL